MRVALVCGYDWAAPGGVRNQVAAIARALGRRGDDVTVIAPGSASRGTEATVYDSETSSYRVVLVGRSLALPANGSIAPIAPTPIAVARTLKALRSSSFEVVHVHEPLLPGPPLAAVLGTSRPVVGTFHRAGTDRLYRADGRLLGRAVMKRIDTATAVSQAALETARDVLSRHLPPVIVIPNGIDIARFEQSRAERETKHQVSASGRLQSPWKNGTVPLVVFVGRHEKRKGLGVLVNALPFVREELEVVIAGTGPESAAISQAVRNDGRVRLVGPIDDEAVASLMARADVVVAPAISGESFGVVILEAMAAGTPVVCSDLPGYSLAANGAARLFRRGDARDLARALSDVLGDASLRERLAKQGRERALSCSIDEVVEQYAGLYELAIGTAGRS